MMTQQAVGNERPITSGTSRRPIKVIHLVSTLNIGGLEKVVYDLARLSDPELVSAQVICLGGAGELAASFAKANVPVQCLGLLGAGSTKAIWQVARALRREQPDVLHTHNPSPHLIGAIAAKLARVPVVVHTKHGRNYPDQPRRVRANRVATWLSSRVVAVSNDAAAVARDVEQVSRGKVEVIFNGIDLEHDTARVAKGPPDARRAVHVARLMDPPKDHRTLLRAARIVANEVPEFRLEIVGDGPHRLGIEALCDELDLRRHVTFHGFRHDVHQVLRTCGLALLSTTTEGLSLTLLEAMAAGLPVVATRVGGNSEVVAEGSTGYLVPGRSPDAMSKAIMKLIGDRELSAQMGVNARARVEEHFNLQKVISRYEATYRELLGEVRLIA